MTGGRGFEDDVDDQIGTARQRSRGRPDPSITVQTIDSTRPRTPSCRLVLLAARSHVQSSVHPRACLRRHLECEAILVLRHRET